MSCHAGGTDSVLGGGGGERRMYYLELAQFILQQHQCGKRVFSKANSICISKCT